MSFDNSTRRQMDALLKRNGLQPKDLPKAMEMPQQEPRLALPPLPDLETLRRSGAIPVEDNAPMPMVPPIQAQPQKGTAADDKAPPPPFIHEVKPQGGSPLPVSAPKAIPKENDKGILR